jgi:hypothetical protein
VFNEQITEQRWVSRKVFKAKAVLSLQAREPMLVRTCELGGNGMSLTLPFPLSPGQSGCIQFELTVDNKMRPLKANGKVVYCVYSNGEFRIGFKFMNLDLPVLTAVAKFVG